MIRLTGCADVIMTERRENIRGRAGRERNGAVYHRTVLVSRAHDSSVTSLDQQRTRHGAPAPRRVSRFRMAESLWCPSRLRGGCDRMMVPLYCTVVCHQEWAKLNETTRLLRKSQSTAITGSSSITLGTVPSNENAQWPATRTWSPSLSERTNPPRRLACRQTSGPPALPSRSPQ